MVLIKENFKKIFNLEGQLVSLAKDHAKSYKKINFLQLTHVIDYSERQSWIQAENHTADLESF